MCVNGAVWCKSPDGPRPWCLKCERDRPLPAIGKIKLPVTFGKQWRYGTGVCPLCGRAHSKNQTLLESGGSKAFVEVLLANLVRVGCLPEGQEGERPFTRRHEDTSGGDRRVQGQK